MSGENVKKKFYAYPELTPCARFMQGNSAILFFAVYALLASLFPWEWLFQKAWYHAWIDVVAFWSPNIRMLPDSPSQIVELASAYLAFTNTLGPFYVLISVRCALRHARNPEVYIRNSHISTWTLFKYFVMAVFIVPIMFYGALGYEGGSPSIRPTDLFYTSGAAFIAMNATGWWASGAYTFGMVIITRMLEERLLKNRNRSMK